MIKQIFILFKLARKISQSEALNIVSKFHEPPFFIKLIVKFFRISLTLYNFFPERNNDVIIM